MPAGDEDAAATSERSPTLRHRLEYAGLRSFAFLVTLAGRRASYALARGLGSLVHLVDRRHRVIARVNVRERFTFDGGRRPSTGEIRRIARDSFRHIATCAVELMHLPRVLASGEFREAVDVAGTEHVRAAIAAGRGVIMVTGHFGNWEVLGAQFRDFGVPFATVYRPLDNPLLDRWVRRLRAADTQSVIPKEGALRPMLRQLRAGGCVAVLVDQDARRHGVFAPFFGTPASTIPTPAELALRTGAAIVFAGCVRRGDGFRFEMWYEPPVEVEDTGDHAADLLRITTDINRRLEAAIRRAPEQWLWSHRRWKTKPAGEAGQA